MGIAMRTYVICEQCGITFRGKSARRFCSQRCKSNSQNQGKWSNPEYIRAYMRRYNQEHRLILNAKKAAYKRNNREMFNKMQRARRAAGRSLGKKRSEYRKFIEAIGRCLSCGITDRLEIDHVVPLVAGGKDIPENWQVLCRKCNAQKAISIIDYRIPLPS